MGHAELEQFERRLATRWDWAKTVGGIVVALVASVWTAAKYTDGFARTEDVTAAIAEAIKQHAGHPHEGTASAEALDDLKARVDEQERRERAIAEAMLMKQTRLETLLEVELQRRGGQVPDRPPVLRRAEDRAARALGLPDD